MYIGNLSIMIMRVPMPNSKEGYRGSPGDFESRNLSRDSSHMVVSKIKPCMSQYKLLYGETANGSLKQL